MKTFKLISCCEFISWYGSDTCRISKELLRDDESQHVVLLRKFFYNVFITWKFSNHGNDKCGMQNEGKEVGIGKDRPIYE